MRGYEAINRLLVAAGVETVFQYMSEDTMELLTDMERTLGDELDVIHARHEQGAMAMADGYARTGDRIGVCIVGRGPGIAQTGTALVNSRKNGSRVLAVAPLPGLDDPRDPKRFRQTSYLEATVENVVTIADDTRLIERFTEAIRRVHAGESPLAVQVPKDVLKGPITGADDADLDPGRFDDGLHEGATTGHSRGRPLGPLAGPGAEPDPERIDRVVDLYLDSDAFQPPVILAGRGAVHAREALEDLAERLNAVLVTTLKAKGLFEGHPFATGLCGSWGDLLSNELLSAANFVLAVGCSLNDHTVDDGHLLDGDATVVHVDADRRAIGRFTPVDLGIEGDADRTTRAIADALAAADVDRGDDLWTETLRNRIANHDPLAGIEDERGDVLDPRAVVRKLEAVLPGDRHVSADGGCFRRWVLHGITVGAEDANNDCDFAAIGLGLPVGIGAALYLHDGGEPDPRLPVTFCGDGGLLMSIQELETAVRYDVPMVVVVGNDSSLGSEYHHLASGGFDPSSARLSTPSFAAVAEAMGAEGHRARRLEDIDAVADRLRDPDGPIVLECVIDHDVPHHSY
jgi:thiamine pyrophosphate-dependent acetolactate synthase large subunit-like protein